jgi:hypothetical protein
MLSYGLLAENVELSTLSYGLLTENIQQKMEG